MLADVTVMPRSALLPIYWEAQEDSRLPALLGRSTSVFEGHGEPFEVLLKSALTSPSMSSCVFTPYEEFLAPATYEDAGVQITMAPLLVTRLLRRMSLPLLSSDR